MTIKNTFDRDILKIAVPSIVSNATVPLLGLVDTAITGHLGNAAYIAAIAAGTSIFSLCYWFFSFLRMGTGGLTAQAFGRNSAADCRECLRKALVIAVTAGVAIIVLQGIIADAALWTIGTAPEVERWARLYFSILVWGAPANLALSALNGWFIGMQDAKSPMSIAIGQNLLNIIISSALVVIGGWKIEGVATGTLVAQWTGCAAAGWMAYRKFRTSRALRQDDAESLLSGAASDASQVGWHMFFSVNRDIFLRTTCLIAVMFSFTAFGARQSGIILSANALLMQMFLLVSYIMDGFAYAGEALGGNMLGSGNRLGFEMLTRRLFRWGIGASVIFSLFFVVAGDAFIWILTDNAVVSAMTHRFLWVAVVIPLVSIGAFIYDGLFIGTTATREMLISIFCATTIYFATIFTFDYLTDVLPISASVTPAKNVVLWVAFLGYLAIRGGVQHWQMRGIIERCFRTAK